MKTIKVTEKTDEGAGRKQMSHGVYISLQI